MPKSTAQRGQTALAKNRGSGFEDGFADPPMTPEEYSNERVLYDPSRPFHERIEECIQRFQARRRMTQERSALFAKYLAIGGIDTTQRQFTGTAKHLKDWKEAGYTGDEIRDMAADSFLSNDSGAKGKWYNPAYPEHWDVDFEGVVAGFLGSYLPNSTGLNSHELRLAIDTVLNFLKYVRHHDVCPEYSKDLAAACKVCERAVIELPQVAIVGRTMPGDFNLACRILFCSTGRPIITTDPSQAPDVCPNLVLYEEKKITAPGEVIKIPGAIETTVLAPADFNAELVFKTTVALWEPNLIARIKDTKLDPMRVVRVFEESYQVVDIVFATADKIDAYQGMTANNGTIRTVKPVGYATLYPTIIEDGWDNHPTQAEGRTANPGKPVSLYLDHDVLEGLKPGMKLRLVVCETNVGLDFIKDCSEVLPSFHVFLPQSLMLQWKKPRSDDRMPPSAEDPDAEERRMVADIQADEDDFMKGERKMDPELDRQIKEVEDVEALERAMAHFQKP